LYDDIPYVFCYNEREKCGISRLEISSLELFNS